jgi:hypothetical protein
VRDGHFHRRPAERQPAGQALIRHDAQRIQVCRRAAPGAGESLPGAVVVGGMGQRPPARARRGGHYSG